MALRLLAARRLSEARLHARLVARGIAPDAAAAAVASCRRDGLVDDRLFAHLYVETRRKAVGDARLVAELVRRGIDRAVAQAALPSAENEDVRIAKAIDRLFGARPTISYPSAARALERLGFATPRIYRALRVRAATHGWFADGVSEDSLVEGP